MAAGIDREATLASLPREWPDDLMPEIGRLVRESGRKVVVLDDDPTGTQTVAGVDVLTEWSAESLAAALRDDSPAFFVLTNSRSLPGVAAVRLAQEIGGNLRLAGALCRRDFAVVSRSDSTLRGHYPAEVTALAGALGWRVDGVLLVPFFLEGGRYTLGDVHYVVEGNGLTPAAETEFARDKVFGYRSSNLREWVREKHGGALPLERVASISLETIRQGGPDAVLGALEALHNGHACVVNAASYRDLEVLVLALLRAESQGQRFIYRTAASFVRARAGLAPRSLLGAKELAAWVGPPTGHGGLVVAGSHVARSTAQIADLRDLDRVVSVEVDVLLLLGSDTRQAEKSRVASTVSQALLEGSDALVYTSRTLLTADDDAATLDIGRQVSQALVEIVRSVRTRPAWMIGKGGITASDLATSALGIRRARVLGQALPGVPLWLTGPESRWPGMVYGVFPGNVGEAQSMVRLVEILRQAESEP